MNAASQLTTRVRQLELEHKAETEKLRAEADASRAERKAQAARAAAAERELASTKQLLEDAKAQAKTLRATHHGRSR